MDRYWKENIVIIEHVYLLPFMLLKTLINIVRASLLDHHIDETNKKMPNSAYFISGLVWTTILIWFLGS